MKVQPSIESKALSTLVDADFEKSFVLLMMDEYPDQPLFQVVYECLYEELSSQPDIADEEFLLDCA